MPWILLYIDNALRSVRNEADASTLTAPSRKMPYQCHVS